MSLEHSPAREGDGPNRHTTPDIKAAPDDADRLMTPTETAEMIGVTVRCIENWRGRGGGPEYVRISVRCVRYRRGTVLDFLAERTRAPTRATW